MSVVLKKVLKRLSTGESWYKNFRYKEKVDKPGDVRNIMLIVATLIASVTFQAGVNPPGGVWQDGVRAGRAIYASQPGDYRVFLIADTLSLSASMFVITSLTHGFPFQLEIVIATISMIFTYGSAIFAVTPSESVRFRYVILAAAVPILLRCLIHFFNVIFNNKKSEPQTTEA
ncbi:hypothetical protein ERO13_A12G098000v2 [Gossypium hirsutum]|uniref:PGG domain-containing protein n=1 Tax=Gossypium hirsutum TaxID=3635 RepID=A0A1U8M8N9_GOSHI|nr:uncharacterized protein LOC107934053 [Gossypium hirsutum]KAG4169707.1 hypothetical protein ERO13_A12G098000v2 [Gossypium hirsutum]